RLPSSPTNDENTNDGIIPANLPLRTLAVRGTQLRELGAPRRICESRRTADVLPVMRFRVAGEVVDLVDAAALADRLKPVSYRLPTATSSQSPGGVHSRSYHREAL